MAGRRFKRVRESGQGVPVLDDVCETLATGRKLLATTGPGLFGKDRRLDRGLARQCWPRYAAPTRAFLAGLWGARGPVPITWAEREFDGTPQISCVGLDLWARQLVARIEKRVRKC